MENLSLNLTPNFCTQKLIQMAQFLTFIKMGLKSLLNSQKLSLSSMTKLEITKSCFQITRMLPRIWTEVK